MREKKRRGSSTPANSSSRRLKEDRRANKRTGDERDLREHSPFLTVHLDAEGSVPLSVNQGLPALGPRDLDCNFLFSSQEAVWKLPFFLSRPQESIQMMISSSSLLSRLVLRQRGGPASPVPSPLSSEPQLCRT